MRPENAKDNDNAFDQVVFTSYAKILGREPDERGLAHYRDELESGRLSPGELVRHLKNSPEGRLKLFPGETPRRTLENDTLNDQELRAGKTELASRPYTFNIDLIGRCNMNPPCSMCLDWEGDRGPRHHDGLSLADIEAFGDYLQTAHEIINCSIGEPLLNRDLVPIVQRFYEWGKPFGFNSNGLALTPALTGRLTPYFEILTIIFSLDAASAATYAKVRGRHFEQVIANIGQYCARRREAAPDGLASKTGMVFMPMRCNRHEIGDFIRLGARLGVDVVEIRALNRIDREWVVRRGEFTFDYNREILSPEELEEVRQEAAETARLEGVTLDCQYQVSPEATFSFFKPPHYKELPQRCVLPWRFLLPYQNGDTAPCCFISESLGDWRRTGLEKLWNGPLMKTLRREMADGGMPKRCRSCTSCPVVQAWLREQGSEQKPAIRVEEPSALRIPAPTSLTSMAPQKMAWLQRPIAALRRRFNLELEHSLGESLNRQEQINRMLLVELDKLRKELQELKNR